MRFIRYIRPIKPPNRMEDSWISYTIYAIAYAASIAAFSFKSMALLRIFTVVSSMLYVVYFYAVLPEPLWLNVFSEGALVVLNAVMLMILVFNQRKIRFSEEEKEIYNGVFSRLSPFEFFKLVKAGHWKDYEPGEILLNKGEPAPSIFFIYNGEARVQINEGRAVRLFDGAFIGEMSFSLDKPANADVIVETPSRILYWSQDELRAFLKRNPAMKNHFSAIITEDLAKKLSS
jgi:hypothetical protein